MCVFCKLHYSAVVLFLFILCSFALKQKNQKFKACTLLRYKVFRSANHLNSLRSNSK
jgi:hypothetical protein